MGFRNEIKKYSLVYRGKQSSDSKAKATIYLYAAYTKFIGQVNFYKDSQKLPNNSAHEKVTPKQAYLSMHEHQLARVVDMLRNEKPCRVYYSSPTYAYVSTGAELVGEEESDE